jgi:hypothetical protein
MANMSIMFTMSTTLPGTYVKHAPKAPNKSILQESLNMSIMFTMSTTLPGTYVKHIQKAPNFVYLTRDQSVLYVFFYSSPLLFRKFSSTSLASPSSEFSCILDFLCGLLFLYLRYWWWPCFDPEFCFLRLMWVFFRSSVLLRTDLAWFFLGVCV